MYNRTMLVRSATEMEEEAARFARGLTPNAQQATVVALQGDLGAGKTTFVRGMLRFFGITESVTSPTFVIAKTYSPNVGPFTRIVHIDAYRLHDANELHTIGWDDVLLNPHTLVLLEWPEQVAGALPQESTTVRLSYIDETTREFRVLPHQQI